MEARKLLRDALVAGLPARPYRVQAHPTVPDAVPFVTVLLEPKGIRPMREAPSSHWEVPVDVWVLASADLSGDKRENVLEDGLARVLTILDGQPAVLWDEVERTVTGSFHAYKIAARAVAEKETPSG